MESHPHGFNKNINSIDMFIKLKMLGYMKYF